MTDQESKALEEDDKTEGFVSPGEQLKLLREESGQNIIQLAETLHMIPSYLKALEDDEFDKLPGKIFVKGYYKIYAAHLGADVESILENYERVADKIEATEKSEAKVIRAKINHDQSIKSMAIAAAVIVIVIGITWWTRHA